jgi:adenylate kinase
LKGVVGITGTPGTGKKSVAPLVAAKLGLKCYSLNDLARSSGTLEAGAEVDTSELRRRLRKFEGPAVLFGHLLPYALDRDSVKKVAVLRCEPSVLKRRLGKREYPRRKLIENVEAELIGIEAADAYDSFGSRKTFEVDTTKLTPAESARRVVAVLLGKARHGKRLDWVGGYDTDAKLRSLLSVPES